MALDHLLASLERDATTEAAALLANARTEAASLTAEAAARITRRREATLGTQELALRAAAELAVAQARRAARARVLDARARAIGRVFTAVEERLPAVAVSPPFRGALAARLAAARACIGEGPAAIRCAPGLAPDLRRHIGGAKDLDVRPDPAVPTGFVLASGDGTLEVDETLSARLARRKQELAVEVARALEEDGA
jgi:vacuolar-type H+-ATPase subunit E/Vma4